MRVWKVSINKKLEKYLTEFLVREGNSIMGRITQKEDCWQVSTKQGTGCFQASFDDCLSWLKTVHNSFLNPNQEIEIIDNN